VNAARPPRNAWKMDLERGNGTTGFRFSWRKMELAAQDRAEWRLVAYDLVAYAQKRA